jgi:hypothetical protein
MKGRRIRRDGFGGCPAQGPGMTIKNKPEAPE